MRPLLLSIEYALKESCIHHIPRALDALVKSTFFFFQSRMNDTMPGRKKMKGQATNMGHPGLCTLSLRTEAPRKPGSQKNVESLCGVIEKNYTPRAQENQVKAPPLISCVTGPCSLSAYVSLFLENRSNNAAPPPTSVCLLSGDGLEASSALANSISVFQMWQLREQRD